MGPNPTGTTDLIRRGDQETDTQQRENHMKTQGEHGHPHTKERNQPCPSLDLRFQPPELETVSPGI